VLLLGAAALLSIATSESETQYCNRRQSGTLVPPAPSLRAPRRSGSYTELGVESHTLLWAGAAPAVAGRTPDLYVGREVLAGRLVFSWQRHFSLGASFEVLPPGGEARAVSGPLGATSGVSGSVGLHLAVHLRVSRRCRLIWTNDLWLHARAYRGVAQDAGSLGSPCPAPDPTKVPWDGIDLSFVGRTQVTFGWELGRVQVLWGAGARNVPHHAVDAPPVWNAGDLDPREVHAVVPYVLLGAEVRLHVDLALVAGVSQALLFYPVLWAPQVHLGLTWTPGAVSWLKD
jgi:hypothetical protein